jgi:two-component SAPR family response regulator
LGHSPLIARTTKEALGLLSGENGVDVLFADVGLSADGITLASEVRRRYPQVKILLATALLQVENAANYPLLRKPFDKGGLTEALNGLYAGEPTAPFKPSHAEQIVLRS